MHLKFRLQNVGHSVQALILVLSCQHDSQLISGMLFNVSYDRSAIYIQYIPGIIWTSSSFWINFETIGKYHFLSRTFCPVCIIEFGHTDILSDYVRLPVQIKNPGLTAYHKISWSLEATRFSLTRTSAAEVPVKFQSDTIIVTPNLATSRLHEIWP